jgi:hypothetical protein
LVTLAGYLRYRGVVEDVAVGLLICWAREHFVPVLPDHEIERHVRGIYKRYGLGVGQNQAKVDPESVFSLDEAPEVVINALEEV